MCGRYSMKADYQKFRKKFAFLQDHYFDIHGYKVRPEIFPGTEILAINNEHEAEDLWWTVEDCTADGRMIKAINAKSETVGKVKMFKDAFKNNRVLIPATGFFEWKELPDKKKEKYEFTFQEPLFAFAGIARECEIKGSPRQCGVILTTSANDVVRPIHAKNRMPVILHEYDYEKWLDPATPPDELERIMQPLLNEEIEAKPVEAGKSED
jgi:putative SOS response-associated peptidase YedK